MTDIRWEHREHTGTQGEYLMATCQHCDHESTLVALVGGEIHMQAPPQCQNCGESLGLEKSIGEMISQKKQEPQPRKAAKNKPEAVAQMPTEEMKAGGSDEEETVSDMQ